MQILEQLHEFHCCNPIRQVLNPAHLNSFFKTNEARRICENAIPTVDFHYIALAEHSCSISGKQTLTILCIILRYMNSS